MARSRPSHDLTRNRNFNVFWAGQTFSFLGDSVSIVAIPLLMLQLTGSLTQMGVVTALYGVAVRGDEAPPLAKRPSPVPELTTYLSPWEQQQPKSGLRMRRGDTACGSNVSVPHWATVRESAMERITDGFLRTPNRLKTSYAKGLIALSILVIVIAALGPFIYDDEWQRAAYTIAMGSIGLGNLTWGIGSLLPEERGGIFFRNLSRPFFLVMLIALPIALYLQLRNGS